MCAKASVKYVSKVCRVAVNISDIKYFGNQIVSNSDYVCTPFKEVLKKTVLLYSTQK